MVFLSMFLLGLLGGLHCAGMCGGIVTALSFRASPARVESAAPAAQSMSVAPVQWYRTVPDANGSIGIPLPGACRPTGAGSGLRESPSARRAIALRKIGAALAAALPMNLGRITTYIMLGSLAGAAGSTLWLLDHALPVQRTLFLLTNLVLIAIGAWLLGAQILLNWTERGGQRLWHRLQPLATRLLAARTPMQLALAGAVWGFVPCGMVYMVLLSALSAGSALDGGLLMAAFGLGTLPNLLALGAGGQWLSRFSRALLVRRLIALSLIGMGVLGVARALMFEPVEIFGLCITPIETVVPAAR